MAESTAVETGTAPLRRAAVGSFVVAEFDSWDLITVPPADRWPATKKRFPVGSKAVGRVVARQRFGVFLDLGDDALGLMELPSLPRVEGSQAPVYPERGAAVEGIVVGYRETNRQVSLVSEDPWSDLGRSELARLLDSNE